MSRNGCGKQQKQNAGDGAHDDLELLSVQRQKQKPSPAPSGPAFVVACIRKLNT
jgi:hypothetical protein